MASRTFHPIQTLDKNVVIVNGGFKPQGVSAPIIEKGNGFSVARTGPGQFRITLQDKYDGCIAAFAKLGLQTAANQFIQLGAVDVTSAKTVDLRVYSSAGANQAEVTDFTVIADTGAKEVFTWTPLAYASMADGEYVYLENAAGVKYAVVYDKTGTPVTPTGSPFTTVPAANVIHVPIVTGDTATIIATKTYLAIRNAFANISVVDGLAGTLTLTNAKMGNAVNPASYNSTSGGAGNVVVTVTTAGAASNLNNTYITFNSALDATAYYAWFNVNSEGVDPAVAGKTAIPVAIVAGDSANNVATALRAALTTALVGVATITGATSHAIITNAVNGPTTDATVGTSGFSVSITQQGNLTTSDIAANADNRIGFKLFLQQRATY